MAHQSEYLALCSKPVMEQAKFFLKAFVLDFQGKFEEVLDIADVFGNFVPGAAELGQLREFDAHLYLEKRGETLTVVQLRDYLRSIQVSNFTPKVAFVEYLLWKYRKDLNQLFTPPPEGAASAALLRALDEAIQAYLETKEADRARVAEMERLSQIANSEKRTVASVHAKNKQDELAGQEFGSAFAKMQALKKKREAEEALAKAPKVDPYAEEQKRLAEEKERKDEEERRQRDEARARLKARAAAFQA